MAEKEKEWTVNANSSTKVHSEKDFDNTRETVIEGVDSRSGGYPGDSESCNDIRTGTPTMDSLPGSHCQQKSAEQIIAIGPSGDASREKPETKQRKQLSSDTVSTLSQSVSVDPLTADSEPVKTVNQCPSPSSSEEDKKLLLTVEQMSISDTLPILEPDTTSSETKPTVTELKSFPGITPSVPPIDVESLSSPGDKDDSTVKSGETHSQMELQDLATPVLQTSFVSNTQPQFNTAKAVSPEETVPHPVPSSQLASSHNVEDVKAISYTDLNKDNPMENQSLDSASVPTAAGDAARATYLRKTAISDSLDIPHILPNTVRDASLQNGQRDADEAYNKLFVEYYPKYRDRVYRIPPMFIGHHPFVSERQTGDLQSQSSETFQVYGTTRSHVMGDKAELIVADCIQDLLMFWVEDKCPAFIITSFQFENFCDKKDEKPVTDTNMYNKPKEKWKDSLVPEVQDGEHDVLIIHYKYGLVFIQVKSCEGTTDPNNTVKKAIEQTKADEAFFATNFDDLNTGVSIRTCVALPDNTRQKMEQKWKNCTKRIKENYGGDLWRCLFKEDLPRKYDSETTVEEKKNLVRWWKDITRNCSGFRTSDDYKRVVARYIGFKSTVKIPLTHQSLNSGDKQLGRTVSSCVSEIGNRYMNIVLTPQQVYILPTERLRLIIRGNYGTGKTVLLILKVRTLMKQLKKVCVISMSHSPLIKVLEESVKYDIDPKYYAFIRFETAYDQQQLTKVLEMCATERFSVFIDEFPSFLFPDSSLHKTIQDYPSTLLFWCVMSRERDDKMSRGLQRLFSETKLKFEEVIMKKVLRCPPSIQSFSPKDPEKDEKVVFTYLKQKWDPERNKRHMAEHLHSLGLSTPQTRKLVGSTPTERLKWSDVVVLEPELASRPFLKQLLKWKIPVLRISDVVNVSKIDINNIKQGLPEKSVYTQNIEHVKGVSKAQRVANISGTANSIYINGAKGGPVEPIADTDVAVAMFLHQNGFINEEITKACQTVHIEANIVPRNWCDVIFVDGGEVAKPVVYTFLESLGVPLVTPSSTNNILTDNCVLYTNKRNYEGFQRKESITLSEKKDDPKGRVVANVLEPVCVEGPETIYVDHTKHEGSVDTCNLCRYCLKEILFGLGLKTERPTSTVSRPSTLDTGGSRYSVQASEALGLSENLLELARNPRRDLSFADVVILEDRQNPQSARKLFQECGIPVMDKLGAVSLEEDAFSYEMRVLYTKASLFKGLERKVVIIVRSKSQCCVPAISDGIIEDSVELAITRCASQLIIIST